jgi:hypothetical protein
VHGPSPQRDQHLGRTPQRIRRSVNKARVSCKCDTLGETTWDVST